MTTTTTHMLFGNDMDNNIFFTALITEADIVAASIPDTSRLIITNLAQPETPISDKLMALSELFLCLEETNED